MFVPILVSLLPGPVVHPQDELSPPEPPLIKTRPYSLFNPSPRDRLRPLSADRPDTTESAITVDAGHYQFEVSLGDWARERREDVFIALQMNAKVGLTESIDLQLVFDSYVLEDSPDGEDGEGFGDFLIRTKLNVWGNDGGPSAFAFFPYIKIPTGSDVSNDELEGGLILPYARSLTDTLDLGLMAQFDAVYDEEEDDHDLEFLHTAVLGAPIAGDWGAFYEYVGIAAEDDYTASFNVGITNQPTPNLLLDAGVRVGITDDADDLGIFLGFTARY
ncbi:MAG: transporter [Planctomycetota bacterium]